jgi:hypothetical protein
VGNGLYLNSVQPSTRQTYSSAERRWFDVAAKIGTDPCMRMIPREWNTRTDAFAHSTITWQEACMVVLLTSFLLPKILAPRTVGTYMSGVKKYLQNQGVSTAFFQGSQYILNTTAALAHEYRRQANRTAQDAIRMPITMDMILSYHTHSAPGADPIKHMALGAAQLLGFTMVARVSEYLYTKRSKHWLTTDRIVFETDSNVTVPAHLVHQNSHLTPRSVTIHVRSKKNDQVGRGYRYHFQRAGAGEAYCIASSLWEYALAARPLAGKSLFYVPQINWTLKACHLSAHLKRLGDYFGLDTTRISTHSLRIGGASTLAAAGLSDSEIQRMGDWRSTSFLRYLRLNLQLFQKARVALSTGTVLTVDDVRRVYGRQGEHQV